MEVKLVMFRPDGRRKDFPIGAASTIIGRGEDCGLRVPILSVSRHHCELQVSEEGVSVRDMGSANGTYVNSSRVDESELGAGDRLVVGPVAFTVQVDGQPEEITPPEPQEAGAGDDIVDLEADVTAGSDEAVQQDAFAGLGDEEQEGPVDPIAALEALAAESEKKKQGE